VKRPSLKWGAELPDPFYAGLQFYGVLWGPLILGYVHQGIAWRTRARGHN
jgi:hypothetical protein